MPDYCLWVVDLFLVVTVTCQVYKEWMRNGLEMDIKRADERNEKSGQQV